ncbi:MAG: glutathione S-transferase N-terminal domain-containing protein [Gaiellaceae bacterium]
MLELYQAEWCPYSSAVRERLTELGIDFVAKQVAPRQEDREGEHEIPLLVTEDGERLEGTDAVFEYLPTLPAGEWERGHRAQYRAHREDRAQETTAEMLENEAAL